MMRSLFSGVAGLKVHQTKMDVIGNNIANVNTVGFKSSSVNFSDVLYQTTQSASGANEATGLTGKNPKQIGIGSQVASITTNVKGTGGTQRTDEALDCMISGDAFFIVNFGGVNYFTKAGSFGVDATGTLCTAAGAAVMGWQVNEDGTDIIRSSVSKLSVMSPENMTSSPEATRKAYVTGNVDSSDPSLLRDEGVSIQVSFYDNLGNEYNLQLGLKAAVGEDGTTTAGNYTLVPQNIIGSDKKSIFLQTVTEEDGTTTTTVKEGMSFTFGGITYTPALDEETGELTFGEDVTGPSLVFDPSTGAFRSVGGEEGGEEGASNKTLTLSFGEGEDAESVAGLEAFRNVEIDFSTITQYVSNGKCSLEGFKGAADKSGEGAGRKMGEMMGLSIDSSGKIFGTYDNGTTKLLGQIAVTTFANATGLEAIGNSMFATTQNSGDFDGIGKDITETGGEMITGVLEMSNVDLSTEFTQMITTQRGFQSNSRIITTSDTMLEELINLKR
ncbi:MAG: flagellar hook-basal body complex protein [Lachnospiraceae bacterium]|nr:flagellar hook-basal body complex protein [Lachnospiraceae bacterium]